ncbi:restriction endonuclease subunit S [Prevotella koreensis]
MKNNEHNVIPFIQRILNDAEVEWKPLGEVTEYEQPSKYLVKTTNYKDSFTTPVLTAGKTFILGYTDECFGIYEASKHPVIIFDDFTTANKWVDFDFKAKSSAMKMITSVDDSKYILKYIYYWLNTLPSELIEGDHKRQWISNYANKRIPIPPLSIQKEIVNILDKFTTLEAQLEAELICRKRQYEYYRNRLLSFDMLNRGGQESNNVTIMSLGELGTFTRGSGLQKKDFTPTGVGCIHYGQIYTYYGTYTYKTKSFVSPDTAKKLKQVEYGDVIITNTSENIQDVCKTVVYMGKEPIVTGGHASIFKPSDKIIGKYLAYYTQTEQFTHDKRRFVKGTKVIDVSANDLTKIKIPVPPLAEQERIVSILDKFDSLTNSISEGLPKEIELRRKQYEYYRNELLSFSRIWTHEPCVPTL